MVIPVPALLDVLTWQGTVASDDGPKDYTMRLVLLAIAARMLVEGTNAVRLSGDDIAAASGLSKLWAMKMAKGAVETGWLTRALEPGHGRGWRSWTYRLRLPDGDHHDAGPDRLAVGALRSPLCRCGRVRSTNQGWCAVCKAAYQAKWRKTHPLEGEARARANVRAVANVAQRRGKLRKERCWECGAENVEKHHEDYDQPLQVAWLCRNCHVGLHNARRTASRETQGRSQDHKEAA